MGVARSLTEHPDILKITDEIRRKAEDRQYLVSDVILEKDGFEYQFVDLVMEGGGTLGIALVGYIHALEQAGIRFLGIGGSSVGAIVALLAYCFGERMEAKGEKLAVAIADMNLGEMLDGNYFARKLSILLGSQDVSFKVPKIILNALLAAPQLLKKIGLNPGEKLYEWIAARLKENGINTLEDMERLINALPEGMKRRGTGAAITDYNTSLRIVAADITTSTKVIFPDMAEMYFPEPKDVNPASFARASASIPFFFQPFAVSGISQLIGNNEKWERLGGFTGDLPDKVSFADGGLLSNFPIDLFKRQGMIPRAPTLGARLSDKDRSVRDPSPIGRYLGNLFIALQHCADYDFIFKNPLYKHLITHIPTNQYHWLDFNMSDANKLGLFLEGVRAGYDFLERFDWEGYKSLREAELKVNHAHESMLQRRNAARS